jgi:hypothetical protein
MGPGKNHFQNKAGLRTRQDIVWLDHGITLTGQKPLPLPTVTHRYPPILAFGSFDANDSL